MSAPHIPYPVWIKVRNPASIAVQRAGPNTMEVSASESRKPGETLWRLKADTFDALALSSVMGQRTKPLAR
jgi:hypothetical protein